MREIFGWARLGEPWRGGKSKTGGCTSCLPVHTCEYALFLDSKCARLHWEHLMYIGVLAWVYFLYWRREHGHRGDHHEHMATTPSLACWPPRPPRRARPHADDSHHGDHADHPEDDCFLDWHLRSSGRVQAARRPSDHPGCSPSGRSYGQRGSHENQNTSVCMLADHPGFRAIR